MSDVRLDRGFVGIEGQLRVEGPDIHVDEVERRSPDNTRRHRRAIVHGYSDELVINYDSDYKGVVINAQDDQSIKLNGRTFIKDVDVLQALTDASRTISHLLEERGRILAAVNTLERKANLAITPIQDLKVDVDIGDVLGRLVVPPLRY